MKKDKFKIIEVYREDRKKINLEYNDEMYYITLYYDGTEKIIDVTMETEDGTIFEDDPEFEEIMKYLENGDNL